MYAIRSYYDMAHLGGLLVGLLFGGLERRPVKGR